MNVQQRSEERRNDRSDPTATLPPSKSMWKRIVARYEKPSLGRSVWQAASTVVCYGVLWYLMHRSVAISYWITLALAILAAGFLVRLFIIFHDCGHGSFFKSRKANDTLGVTIGILTFTPYYQWRHRTCYSPRHLWRPGSARNRRCLDHDSARVPRSVSLAAVRLSAGTKPCGVVRHCPAPFVCGRTALPVAKGGKARAHSTSSGRIWRFSDGRGARPG